MQNEEGRFGAATDEQIALADSIADKMYPRTHPGWIGGQACALRAIRITTELAAKMAEWAPMVPPDGGSPTAEESDLAEAIAAGLRAAALSNEGAGK